MYISIAHMLIHCVSIPVCKDFYVHFSIYSCFNNNLFFGEPPVNWHWQCRVCELTLLTIRDKSVPVKSKFDNMPTCAH